jgi:L-lactate dehydrogenase complex protein LldG
VEEAVHPVNARERILDRIRAAVSVTAGVAPDQPISRGYRTAHLAVGLVELLTDRLIDYRAQVRVVRSGEVADVLAELAAGRRLGIPAGFPSRWSPPHAVLADRLADAHELDRLDGVMTTCALAIAETGTLVLDGGPGQGSRALTLVPDHHVCLVRADQIVASVPQAIARLDPVRAQTWISGPSATSDIELNRIEGVHGPRTLEVVIIAR